MSVIRVNMRSAVNASLIRRERIDGREHIIVPSSTLPDNVIMNNHLYPADEIAKAYKTLEGTPAPLGHPKHKGQLINASSPHAINGYWVGAYNQNVRRENGRVHLDKVIDVEVAERTEGGRRLIDAINAGQPIHTSTGLMLEAVPAPKGSKGFAWVATNMEFDHDAILLDEQGAATPDQGVGMMVNGESVTVINMDVGEAVLTPEASMTQKRERLNAVVPGWVVDFDEAKVVFEDRSDKLVSQEYTDDGLTITLTGTPEAVTRRVSWVKSLPLVNRLLGLINSGGENPNPNEPEADTMDPKDLQAALAANNAALGETIAAALKPLADQIAGISSTFEANQRAGEKAKRDAVAEVLGEASANLLTGNALDEAHARLTSGKAAVITTGNDADENGRAAYDQAPE